MAQILLTHEQSDIFDKAGWLAEGLLTQLGDDTFELAELGGMPSEEVIREAMGGVACESCNRKYCLDAATTLMNEDVDELLDAAERIQKWLRTGRRD